MTFQTRLWSREKYFMLTSTLLTENATQLISKNSNFCTTPIILPHMELKAASCGWWVCICLPTGHWCGNSYQLKRQEIFPGTPSSHCNVPHCPPQSHLAAVRSQIGCQEFQECEITAYFPASAAAEGQEQDINQQGGPEPGGWRGRHILLSGKNMQSASRLCADESCGHWVLIIKKTRAFYVWKGIW